MYAIVEISGKQYKVCEGDIVFVDRLEELEEGSSVTFDKVLFISDKNKFKIGEDTVKGAKVEATVVGHGKSKKVLVYKYKAKKNERKMRGHRQPYTKIQIEKITAGATRAKKEETAEKTEKVEKVEKAEKTVKATKAEKTVKTEKTEKKA